MNHHDYDIIEMTQKKVLQLKNRGKLQRLILLLLRELSQNYCLTKTRRKLERKTEKLQELKGRKQTKVIRRSRGMPRFL